MRQNPNPYNIFFIVEKFSDAFPINISCQQKTLIVSNPEEKKMKHKKCERVEMQGQP